MFSFRRKSKKVEPQIRQSPSLPYLKAQGIPWPENFVDVSALQPEDSAEFVSQGAHPATLTALDGYPLSFHKPFRIGKHKGPISSLYMSAAPSSFDKRKSTAATTATTLSGRQSQRRARVPPSFNIMVAGSQGVGKTSLLRLLFSTADISPTATAEHRAALNQFLKAGRVGSTEALQCTSVEICESRFDRVMLSVIDTPGLDLRAGRELKLELQVNDILKYVDAQYAETMSEESKVVRTNKGDRHVHLCIYMIDPASVQKTSPSTRDRSNTTNSHHTPELVPDNSDDSEDEAENQLSMSPSDIKIIRRLSQRCNIIPVIGHSDSLTDERLVLVKEAIRRGFSDAGVGFGVFGPPKTETPKRPATAHFEDDAERSDDEEQEERPARSVIKLRPRNNRKLSRSRSRRDLTEDIGPVDALEPDSIANVRFSAHAFSGKPDISQTIPFAFIAPEPKCRRPRPVSEDSDATSPTSPVLSSEDDAAPHERSDTTPTAHHRHQFLQETTPQDLRGVFTRKFRWGTIDVLNPEHCDFSALRTAILSTHFKMLKTHTKEVLYEKFRTDRLLTRRATRHLTEEEVRQRAESA